MTRTLRVLMTDLIDYAGLFPPAKLPMPHAVEAYARALRGEHAWVLGRFICPVSRLGEFEKSAGVLLPGTLGTSGYREHGAGEPWRLSALQDGELERDLDAIAEFNERHQDEGSGLAVVDMVEVKVDRAAAMDRILDRMPEWLRPFFEFPVNADCRGFVAALAGNPAGAKIRTGGVTASAFPTPAEVAAFLAACARAEVPFKATAGLHHPVRSTHPMTYEPGSPTGTMHGFVNVFMGSALLGAGHVDEALLRELLGEEDPSNFRFAEEVAGWRDRLLPVADLALARERFAHSFGSCSFDEPIADLRALGWL